MRIVILAAIAITQMAFLVAMFFFLLGRRLADARRLRRRAAQRAQLTARMGEVLAGAVPPEAFVRSLPRRRAGMVTAVLQQGGTQVRGEAWERLVAAVRQSDWFRQVLASRARSPWWWRRLVAARLLSIAGDEQDLPHGLRLVADRHPGVRLAAVQLVRRLPDLKLVESVLEQGIRAPRVVRQHYFDVLTSVREQLAPVLVRRLDAPRDSYELRAMLNLAGDLAAPDLMDRLLAHAASPSADARTQVARALGHYPHPCARDALVSLLVDPEWEVRTQAAASLGAIHATDAREPLRQALSDVSWWVRLRAAIALRQLGDGGAQVLRQARGGADRFAAEMAGYVLGLSEDAVADYAA
jgi:HEAT repeat protein